MALGKSLGNILGDYFGEEQTADNTSSDLDVREVLIEQITITRHQQRQYFEESSIELLAESIAENGLIHPVLVLQKENNAGFVLLSGERRLRAFKSLGKTKIPATVRQEKSLSQGQQATLTAVENLQREDLTPIEQARTYQAIADVRGLNNKELAKVFGMTEQYVGNYLKLLKLVQPVQDALATKRLTEAQARMLTMQEPQIQIEVLEKILKTNMSVREIQRLLTSMDKIKHRPKSLPFVPVPHIIRAEVVKISKNLPKANIKCKGDEKKGQIIIKWG